MDRIDYKELFIEKSRVLYNNKYDYSKVEYINARTKVCIICPEHGEFWMTPDNHLRGHECPSCKGVIRHTTNSFIEKAKIIHGSEYVYTKVNYVNQLTKVCIICPEHGEFWTLPSNFLQGHGCPSCAGNKKYTRQEFIDKSLEIHGTKYDYSKLAYNGIFSKVCIICPEHGEFWQTAHQHLLGDGCPECGKIKISEKLTKTTIDFVNEAKEKFSNRYDYSKVVYGGAFSKVCIICPEHGEFFVTPDSHLHSSTGCPKCTQSKMEVKVSNFLTKKEINFIYEKRFKWLKNKGELSLDFYLPEYNIGIECQGKHHFEPVNFGGKMSIEEQRKNLEIQKTNDAFKKEQCEKNGVKLYYINYFDKNIEEKLSEILNINE